MDKMSFWYVFLLIYGFFEPGSTHGDNFAPSSDQNATLVRPYPYQIALGANPFPLPTLGNPPPFPGGMPYPYPYGPVAGNPWPGQAFPGYPQQYFPGFQQPFGAGFPGWGAQPEITNGATMERAGVDKNDNIPVEILDVSPEYQRQLLGWPSERSSGPSSGPGNRENKPRFIVDIDSHTTNSTQIPVNLTKPIITEKKYITSIRKSFVYDPSKPENNKPINIHLVNGQQVTTLPPTTTTESENVEDITAWYDETNITSTIVAPKGRRFMDVPKTCPGGSRQAHNGACINIFVLKSPVIAEEGHNSAEDGL